MNEELLETEAEIAALIPRYSWEIMDDDQRDGLMRKVILPRYMDYSIDGTQLTPKWWSDQVGASPGAIKNRVYRLQAKDSADPETGTGAPSDAQIGHVRGARGAISNHPELAAKLLENPDVAAAIEAAQLDQRAEEEGWERTPPLPDESQFEDTDAGLWVTVSKHLTKATKEITEAAELVENSPASVAPGTNELLQREADRTEDALDRVRRAARIGAEATQ